MAVEKASESEMIVVLFVSLVVDQFQEEREAPMGQMLALRK